MTPKPNGGAPDSAHFRSHPMMRFPMGKNAELLYLPLKKEAKLVTPSEASLLAACGQFATIQGHVERALNDLQLDSADAPGVAEILEAFSAGGVMLSVADLMSRVTSLPRTDPPPRITWLAIPTCNRPELLLRCIQSYGDHFRECGRFPKLLVADDSRTRELRVANRAVVEGQAGAWGAEVVYIGLEGKLQMLNRLAADGIGPRATLEFAILGPKGEVGTFGANRNAILLLTAGDMVLSVDDDTVCEPRSVPEGDSTRLRMGSDGDSTGYWFFPDRTSALDYAQPAEVDILSAHETMLGKQVTAVLQQALPSVEVDFHSACAHLLQGIWAGTARVVATLNGSVGDSGKDSVWPVLTGGRQRLREGGAVSEQTYRLALSSREMARQVPCSSVCHAGPFMGAFFGIDNRSVLPPFVPSGSNEDGTFGHLMNLCFRDTYLGYLPWSLVHDPPGRRTYQPVEAPTAESCDFVALCASEWGSQKLPSAAEDRIDSLGRHFVDLASMTAGDFQEYVRIVAWRQAARKISRAEALLDRTAAEPAYWADHIRAENHRILSTVEEPNFALPSSNGDDSDPRGPVHAAQELILSFGKLALVWPDLQKRTAKLFDRSMETRQFT